MNKDTMDRTTLSRAVFLYGKLLKVTDEQRIANSKDPEQIEKIRDTQIDIIKKLYNFINDADFDSSEELKKLIVLKIHFLEADRDHYAKLEKKTRRSFFNDTEKELAHEKYYKILSNVLEELQETEEYLKSL